MTETSINQSALQFTHPFSVVAMFGIVIQGENDALD